jgi:predicted small metal-binding protein
MPAPTMTQTKKWYTLPCECGFSARSHDQEELIEIGLLHVRRLHPEAKGVDAAGIRNKIKAAT